MSMFNKITVDSSGKLLEEALAPAQPTSASTYAGSTGEIPHLPQPPMPTGTTVYILPSGGAFYNGVDTVQVLPLTIGQVVDVDRVYKGKTVHEQFQRFVSIVNQSVYGVSVLDLTIQDFYAVCYYLRLISYPADPIVVEAEVEVGGQMRKLNAELKADGITVRKMQALVAERGVALDYPRVRDHLFAMQAEDGEALTDWERGLFGYVAGATAQEKLANFRNLPSDRFKVLVKHQIDSFHGIEPLVRVTTPKGEEVEQEVSFDYSMFFPSFIQASLHHDSL